MKNRTIHTLSILSKCLLMPLALVIGMLFAACSDEVSGGQEGPLAPLQLMPLVSRHTEGNALAKTRTPEHEFMLGGKNFCPYSELYPTPINKAYATIGAFLAQDGTTSYGSLAGYFAYETENSWSSSVGVRDEDYYIFGYMPSNIPGLTASITQRTGGTWANGAVLLLQKVPTIIPADVCVIVGVLKGDDNEYPIYHDSVLNGEPGLQQGVYAYDGDLEDNYVYLLLDHLYTNVNLELQVDERYDELRTIVLKKVSMSSMVSNTVDLRVTLTNDQVNPVANIETFTSAAPPVETVLFPEEGQLAQALSTTKTSVPGYFAPGETTQNFNFEFVYDVYDKKNIDADHPYGNLVRANCVARNSWQLKGTEVINGKSFKVRATIKPTYLYQLSEPDLDNPVIVLEDTTPAP